MPNQFQSRELSPTLQEHSVEGHPMGRRYRVECLTPAELDLIGTIRDANTGRPSGFPWVAILDAPPLGMPDNLT